MCHAGAVLRAATDTMAKLVVSGGKAWRRARCGFNHSPPPPATRRATLLLVQGRLILGIALAVAAGKASERTKASAGGRAGFARLLAVRCYLPIDRDGIGEHCERTNKGSG